MKIAIDIRGLQTSSARRGIGAYVYNLVRNILSQDKINQYFLILFKDKNLPFEFAQINSKNLCYISYPNLYQLGWFKDNLTLNKELEKHNFDIVHFTNAFEFFFGCNLKEKTYFKKILTLYDLTPFHFSREIFSGRIHRKFLKLF